MSNGYNSRLAPGYDKGKCGDTEFFIDEDDVVLREKCAMFAALVRNAKHVVIHTGAGISTAAGIPDFRGPKGIWTAELNDKTPNRGVDFKDARPSLTHMVIKGLMDAGRVHYLITQNVDGLHLKSGVPRDKLSELHGSVFSESCPECAHEYVHANDIGGIGLKKTGRRCIQLRSDGSTCNGELRDNCLDWENALPEVDLNRADDNHRKADVAICIGTSLRIRPAGNMAMKTVRKNGKPEEGKLVIINLQTTHLDRQCTIRFHARCDKVMSLLAENLGIEIPEFDAEAYHKKVSLIPLPPPAPPGAIFEQRRTSPSNSSSSNSDTPKTTDGAADDADLDHDELYVDDSLTSPRKRQRSSFMPPVPTHSYGTRARSKRARTYSDTDSAGDVHVASESLCTQRTYVDLTETTTTSSNDSSLSLSNSQTSIASRGPSPPLLPSSSSQFVTPQVHSPPISSSAPSSKSTATAGNAHSLLLPSQSHSSANLSNNKNPTPSAAHPPSYYSSASSNPLAPPDPMRQSHPSISDTINSSPSIAGTRPIPFSSAEFQRQHSTNSANFRATRSPSSHGHAPTTLTDHTNM